jgi:prepilin-type N-terminal cleavage/methylation domain-containing protein
MTIGYVNVSTSLLPARNGRAFRRAAFTHVELLVVIAIIGVLVESSHLRASAAEIQSGTIGFTIPRK